MKRTIGTIGNAIGQLTTINVTLRENNRVKSLYIFFIQAAMLPGHVGFSTQSAVCVAFPEQSMPPLDGYGSLHDLDREESPVPHVNEQEPQVDQSVQPPSTLKIQKTE